jgi:protein O-mannosyl-transferase
MVLPRRTAAALVFVLSLLLYLPALRNGFAYDDVAIIERDSRIHTLSNVPSLFTQGYWVDSDLALYRPLTTSSFALDWAVSGGRAAWFHFMNAVWNATVCTLVLLFLARIVSMPAALVGALLFAAHPVHVEAVANGVGRAEVMGAAFVMAAILLWPQPRASRTGLRLTGVAALFLFALLTKESTIMLPALLILVDVGSGHLRPRTARAWLRSRAAALVSLAAVAAGYLIVRAMVLGALAPARFDAALEVTAGAGRILTALQAWPVILRLLLYPRVLLADYGPRILMPAQLLDAGVVAGAMILLSLTVGALLLWRRGHGAAAMAALWLPAALLPVSNLIVPIGIIVAERTLYLPSLAVAVTAALLAERMLRGPVDGHAAVAGDCAGREAVGSSAAGREPVTASGAGRAPAGGSFAGRVAVGVAFAVVLTLFAVRTTIRIPDWRSTDTIFAALLRDRPDSFRAHWHQARLHAVAGRADSALVRYAHALDLWPYRQGLVLETTRAAGRLGQVQYARDLARFAHVRWPHNADAARLYAAATIDMGDTIAARAVIDEALRQLPGDSLLLRMRDAVAADTIP